MSMVARLWLRRVTAVMIFLLLAGAGGWSFLQIRAKQRQPPEVKPEEINGSDALSDDDPTISVTKGLEVSERIKGKLIFALDSLRSLGLSSGWQEIEGVRMQLFTDGEGSAVLNCDKARFHLKSRDAKFSGAVHIEFSSGGFLRTDRGSFDAATRTFSTDGAVVFAGGGGIGQAGRASYQQDRDRLILDEDVVIKAEGGATLHARQLVYDRSRHRVFFPEGCRIVYPTASIEAPSANFVLSEEDNIPDRLRMSDGVTFESIAGGMSFSSAEAVESGEIHGWAETVYAERDAGGGWQVTATTTGPWVTLRALAGPDFLERTLRTWSLHAVVGDSGVLSMRAAQVVCMRDIPLSGSPRWAEARNARVWYRNGLVSDMELTTEVELRTDAVTASGTRARLSEGSGMIMLHGEPDGRSRASLVSGRGRISSDQVRLFQADGRAEARGNVQGRLDNVTLLGAMSGADADLPLHFAASSLDSLHDGQEFHLKGESRAWQGERFLFADELLLSQQEQTLKAQGHVRTIMPAAQVTLSGGTVAGGKDTEVLITARSLAYDRSAGVAAYRGDVKFTDEQHVLSAAELTLNMTPSGAVDTVEAVGAVDILELATGRRMSGQRAVRRVAARLVEVYGAPVQVTDEKGNRHTGTSLTWDQASGRVSIAGGPDSQTETIMFPEE